MDPEQQLVTVRRPIRFRLTIAFLLAAVVPALLVGLVQLTIHLHALETIATEHVDSHIAVLKEKLDRFLNVADRDLRSLCDTPAVTHDLPLDGGEGATRALVNTFVAFLRYNPDYYRLRYIDRHGAETIKIHRRAGSAEFREAAAGELEYGVGAYLIDRLDNVPHDTVITFPGEILDEAHHRDVIRVITFARPVWSGEALRGLLVLDVLAENYFRIVDSSGLPPFGVVAVADREGHYLYHSGYRRDWNLLLASRDSDNVLRQYGPAVAAQLLSGNNGRIAGGRGQIISFVPFRVGAETSYVLFYAVPERVLFAAIASSRRFFLFALITAALAAAILAGITARHFTDPVNALRAGAFTIASGDLTRRIDVHSGDEIEALARDFNAMADAVQQREGNLRALRDYQHNIIESLNDGIIVVDRELTVHAFNSAVARMSGVDAANAIGKRVDSLFPQARSLNETLRRALCGEIVECEGILPTGAPPRITSELCLPMHNEAGETTGAILRVTDVTARRFAERALAEAKRTLQTIFDGIKAGIRLISADHRVIAANQYHERLLGRSSAEMIGDVCWAAFDGQQAVCISCPGNVAMRTGTAAEAEFERSTGDGRTIVLQVDAYPVFAEGPQPAGFIEFIQDISEKRRLEREIEQHASELETTVLTRTAALRASEERYRDLVENSPEMIHLLSPEGRFLHANKTEREKLGYTLEQLCASTLDDLVPPREQPKLARHRRELATRGRSRVVTTFLTRAGEAIEVEIDATAQFEEGKLSHARAFVRDITERKRMEERLFQTEKMVSVGQLVSGIAHEIGTPLNAISGTAELLLLQNAREDAGREDLEAIVVQTRRISNLVRQLLDFARPTRSRRALTDIHEALRSALRLMARPLSSAGIVVHVDFTPATVTVRADPHQLQQVFINILLNAQQAMPNGGTIRVFTRPPTNGARDVEVVIEDSGPGIPEQHLKRIFEPFFTTKDVGKGTGLGLAICATIVRQHGGTLRAENAPKGARFVIALPLTKGGASR